MRFQPGVRQLICSTTTRPASLSEIHISQELVMPHSCNALQRALLITAVNVPFIKGCTLTFLTRLQQRALLCCILHPGKPEEGILVGGTPAVSFAVNSVLRVNRLRVNNSISYVVQCIGLLSKYGDRDRYQPCLFPSRLEVHLYISMTPTGFQNHAIATGPNQVCQQQGKESI